MACSRFLVCVLLHHCATLAWATQAAESVATGEAALLHTHSLKAAQLRGLRAKSHTSHGLRANVFRAAVRSRSQVKLRSQQAPAPLYVPKMGLANVTQPTPYPPPPPVLKPWEDHQPLDTAVGNYLISGFIAQPTVTPPPSQESLDLAFACPALLTWPNQVSVSAPDPCGSVDAGNWSGLSDNAVQIQWSQSCFDTVSPGITPPSVSAITKYSLPNGDLFGTSQERQGWFGKWVEIRDCGGATVYTIEEKVYKQTGKPDEESCKKYNSCDGVVYFQYFIKDMGGNLVAMTPYTTIFQEAFDITDPTGAKIASVSREGWSPADVNVDCSNAKPRTYSLKYESNPPGIWATVTNQWPMAAFITMMGQRDTIRLPNGAVPWSNCESLKATGYAVASSLGILCCMCTPMIIFLVCSAPILRFVSDMEARLFPKRMGKPAIYGN